MHELKFSEVKVWDPFIRIAHWLLAVALFVAYFTEDEALTVHIWAGYLIGTLVILRILWGFVGPRRGCNGWVWIGPLCDGRKRRSPGIFLRQAKLEFRSGPKRGHRNWRRASAGKKSC